LLGPARFDHMGTCTREVCRAFKTVEEVEECIGTLHELDDELVHLRAELSSLTAPTEPEGAGSVNSTLSPARKPDYSDLLDPPDLPRAKRLVTARRNAVKSLNTMLSSRRAKKS